MSEYKTLFKYMLKNSVRGFKNSLGGKNRSEKKHSGRFIFLLGILALIAFIYLVPFAYFCGNLAKNNGIETELFTILSLLLVFISLFLSVSYLLNVMYFNKDTQLLLSMPFKGSTIFYVKLSLMYLYLEIMTVVVTLAFGIPYGIGSGVGWSFYLGLLIFIPFMPLLPLFISVVLSPIFVAIASIIKRHFAFMVIAIVIAILAFVGVYILLFSGISMFDGMNLGEIGQKLPTQVIDNLKSIANGLFFLNAFSKLFISGTDILFSILIFLGVHAFYVGVSLPFIRLIYRKGASKQLESSSGGSRSKKVVSYTHNSITSTLIKKEVKTFFRTPILLFYTLFQIVMPSILIIIFSMVFSSEGTNEMSPQILEIMKVSLMTMSSLVMCCGINYMAITCVSREGKSLFVLKSLPIDVKKQLNVKLYSSYIITVLSIIVMSAGLLIMNFTSYVNIIFFTIFSLIMALGATHMQVRLDVKKPRLDWENITQLLQNNSNLLRSMLWVFVLTIIFALLFTIGVLVVSPLIAANYAIIVIWAIIIACALIFFFVMRAKYHNNIVSEFENIEP